MFNNEGYFKEYYVNNKFIGIINDVEKDRDIFGFFGAKTEKINDDLILSNNKKIKKGTTVITYLQILNGRKKKMKQTNKPILF